MTDDSNGESDGACSAAASYGSRLLSSTSLLAKFGRDGLGKVSLHGEHASESM